MEKEFHDEEEDSLYDRHKSFGKNMKIHAIQINGAGEKHTHFMDEGEDECESVSLPREVSRNVHKEHFSLKRRLVLDTASDSKCINSTGVRAPAKSNTCKTNSEVSDPGPTTTCQFNSAKFLENLNNSHDDLSNRNICVCSRGRKQINDSLIGWEPTARISNKHPKNGKYRKFHSGSLNTFHRLYYVTENKDIAYEFHHYTDMKQYMEQYRMCHTVGNVHRKAGSSAEGSDFCIPKLRPNICAIAENCDFLAILSLDRESSSSTENLSHKPDILSSVDNERDEVRMNQTKERPLNLAPVREFSAPDLGMARGAKKLYIALSQYVNLVVPKATLHPDDNSSEKTPRIHNAFVNRRHRYRHKALSKSEADTKGVSSPPKQNESSPVLKIDNTETNVDTPNHTPYERSGSADFPKPKPPSIIRLVATSHGDREKNEARQKQTPASTPQGVLYVGSTVNKEPESAKPPLSKRLPFNLYQTHGRRFKCCERLQEILSHSADDKKDERKEIDKTQKKPDSPEKSSTKTDRILPTPLKPLGVQGRNYKSEEQLTVIYRLQKEKMRRTNTIAEIKI